MEPPQSADVLILGQGLAGSVLAWRLAGRGLSVVVLDRGGTDSTGRPCASHVAAGLVTPVTGKRLTVAGEYPALWESARRFYREVESRTGRPLLAEEPSVRIFLDAAERETFLGRLAVPVFAPHARLAEPEDLPPGLNAPHGGFVMPGAARLRVADFLAATQQWLEQEGRWVHAEVDPDRDVTVTAAGVAIPRLGLTAERLVLCQGYQPQQPRWLDGVRFAPVKGEVLTVDAPTLGAARVTHRGVWIAPTGPKGCYRVGATTNHEHVDAEPTEQGRRELSERLTAAGVEGFTIVQSQAAVRPAAPDRRPTIGFCPAQPRVGWFNGLGAKGTLWAPWWADRLAQDLSGG